jgi:large subunit ribosomal protein L24
MDLRKYVKWSMKAVAPQKIRKDPGPSNLPFLEIGKWNSKFPKLKEKERLAPIDFAEGMCLKVGDLVRVLYGKDAGNDGIIKSIDRKANQVIVSRCNMEKVTWNPAMLKSDKKTFKGPAIVSHEAPIHITNIAPLDPVLKKPTRIKTRRMMTGELVRISKLSRCAMPESPDLIEFASSAVSNPAHPTALPPVLSPEKEQMLAAVEARLAASRLA